MASPWKHPETGVFWYRRRVPDDLRERVGCKIFQRSLRTKDVAEAKRVFLQVAAEIDRQWSDMRANLEPPAPPPDAKRLTPKQMQGPAGEFYRWLVARHDEDPGSAKTWEEKVARERAMVRPPTTSISYIGGLARAANSMKLYGPQIERFLADRQIVVDEGDLFHLNMAVADAGIQAQETLARNARGDYSDDPRASRFPKWEQVKPNLQIVETQKAPLTIDEHFAVFAAERLKPSSRKKYRSCLRDLETFLGSKNLSEATPERLVAWKDDMLTRKVIVKSVEQIGLDTRSIRDGYLAAARSFFDWAKDNKKIATNRMDGIRIKVKKKPEREPDFTEEQAKLILSETLRPPHPNSPREWSAARRWIPWICAYTGARVNEITQMRGIDVTWDVFDGEDVCVINITPEAGSTKNNEGRKVPLHPHLVEQGFPAFVAASGEGPLFYNPERHRGGFAENPHHKKVGERLAEWVRKLGIPKFLQPNHAWRHTFNTVARDVRMIPEIRDAIKGHVPRTEGEKYGRKTKPKMMWPEIKLYPRYEVSPPTGEPPDSAARREATKRRAEERKRAKARSAPQKPALAAAE